MTSDISTAHRALKSLFHVDPPSVPLAARRLPDTHADGSPCGSMRDGSRVGSHSAALRPPPAAALWPSVSYPSPAPLRIDTPHYRFIAFFGTGFHFLSRLPVLPFALCLSLFTAGVGSHSLVLPPVETGFSDLCGGRHGSCGVRVTIQRLIRDAAYFLWLFATHWLPRLPATWSAASLRLAIAGTPSVAICCRPDPTLQLSQAHPGARAARPPRWDYVLAIR